MELRNNVCWEVTRSAKCDSGERRRFTPRRGRQLRAVNEAMTDLLQIFLGLLWILLQPVTVRERWVGFQEQLTRFGAYQRVCFFNPEKYVSYVYPLIKPVCTPVTRTVNTIILSVLSMVFRKM